jgi:hypothetical protein
MLVSILFSHFENIKCVGLQSLATDRLSHEGFQAPNLPIQAARQSAGFRGHPYIGRAKPTGTDAISLKTQVLFRVLSKLSNSRPGKNLFDGLARLFSKEPHSRDNRPAERYSRRQSISDRILDHSFPDAGLQF